MRCSASFMFANAVVDNCTTRVRKCIFSLLGRLTTSTNVIVQSALNSGVYIYHFNIATKMDKGIIHL